MGETMQIRRCEENGVVYITYQNIEKTGIVTHGFSTRVGGISEDYLGSMNLSYTRGDKKENVDENYKRIANAIGFKPEDLVFSEQTHTTNIRKVTKEDRGKGFVKERGYKDVDGLITDEKGLVLATFYADCVPLFFVDKVHGAIGLTHSGWRGTVGKIGKKTVEMMTKEYGTNPRDIVAAIGPSICINCYEVSEDVACEFQKVFTNIQVKKILKEGKQPFKYQLDLWEANRMIMEEAGILSENITMPGICTCCNPEFLYSHRASNGMRGNLGAFLTLKNKI